MSSAISTPSQNQRRAEAAALPGQHQPDHHAEAEDQHGVLVLEAQSRPQIRPTATASDCRSSRSGSRRTRSPARRAARTHSSRAGCPCPESRARSRTASAASPWAKRPPPSSRAIRPVRMILPAPASAGRNPDSRGRDSPNRCASQPGDRRNQGRLVDVSPGQVPPACQVVELIDEVAVVSAGIEMNQQFRDRCAQHDDSAGQQPARAVRRTRSCPRCGNGLSGYSCTLYAIFRQAHYHRAL